MEAFEIRKTGIAGTKVVDGDRNTKRLEIVDDFDQRDAVFDQRGFCQFDFQHVRINAGFAGMSPQYLDDVGAKNLHTGNIHGHFPAVTLILPFAHLTTCVSDDPFAQRQDQAGFLGDRNKFGG